MSPTKILVVEDEILIAEHIKDCLLQFGLKDIYMAHRRKNAAEALEQIKPGLVLLDIHLENPFDGIEIARIIDEQFNCPYIFISANSDLLVIQEAIKTKTAAYITKPIKKADLFAAIQIALKINPEAEERFLMVKDSYSVIKVLLSELLYIEGSGNYIHIVTKHKKIVSRQSLEWIEEQLSVHEFMRIHRSFIVNKHHIKKISTRSVWVGDIELPVSRTHLSKISDYLSSK